MEKMTKYGPYYLKTFDEKTPPEIWQTVARGPGVAGLCLLCRVHGLTRLDRECNAVMIAGALKEQAEALKI